MPPGYTVAPHCFSADGLHFRPTDDGLRACYLLDPRRPDDPLVGKPAAFTSYYGGEETLEVSEASYRGEKFRAAYVAFPGRPADFVTLNRQFALRMTTGTEDRLFEIQCSDLRLPLNDPVETLPRSTG
jgi:hypothetical protein